MQKAGAPSRGKPLAWESDSGAARLVGESARITQLRDLVLRVAGSSSHVLVVGERGSGTELVARAIHEQGPHASADFVAVDCAAASGAGFEVADQCARGFVDNLPQLLARARGGTLFLDDVGALSLDLQGRLLAVLQSQERRPGRNEMIQSRLRLIASTHRDLNAMVDYGAFRADLFFRLDVLRVQVPALRQRRGDIPTVAQALLASLAAARSPGTEDLRKRGRDR